MSDESVVRHLEQFRESGRIALKPSAAIRLGHLMIEEDHSKYLESGKGCAIGAMWLGMGRSEAEWNALKETRSPFDRGAYMFAEAVGMDRDLALRISMKHYGGMSRLQIADWLESQGL